MGTTTVEQVEDDVEMCLRQSHSRGRCIGETLHVVVVTRDKELRVLGIVVIISVVLVVVVWNESKHKVLSYADQY